jgi:hemerythrin superfamily protein
MSAASAQASPQAAEGTTDPLSRRIVAEHNKIEGWFREYERADITPQYKLKLGWEIIRGLSIHAAKEEMVLYPTVAEHFGSAAADKLVEEHQELKNTLYELDGITDPNSPRLDELVQKTIRTTRHHVKDEEENYLPKLAKKVGPTKMEKLAHQFEQARMAAPTRPHPAAPSRPPLNVAANTTAVPLDMARDAIRFGPGNVAGDVVEHDISDPEANRKA